MLITESAYLMHYGTPRHSGRYPWGSGENPYQRNRSFLGAVKDMQKQGLSEKEIAEGLGMTIQELRSRKTSARLLVQREEAAYAAKLREKGMSYEAIGERLGGIGESSVRSLINSANSEKNKALFSTVDMLKQQVLEKGYLDVGLGTEAQLGISRTKLKAALQMLEDEGYLISYTNVPQAGTGKNTSLMVLAAPGTTHKDVWEHKDEIVPVNMTTDDGGQTFTKLGLSGPVQSVDSSRVQIRYNEEGGVEMDGVIEIRRGTSDLSLGNQSYAQVRIPVDDSHYIKGMAIYADDLPDGVDIRFNTNKHKGTPMMSDDGPEVLKRLDHKNPDNPFGSTVYEKKIEGSDKISSLYFVREEGDWSEWARSLPSQFLSKQKPELARKQLGLAYDSMKSQYDEIMSITNPVLRKKMLLDFAEDCDSDAVHLKGAAMPRQTTSVILPFRSMKDTEVYAPNYENGERVVLVRYPHGGIFEIPELVVNNSNADAKRVIGNSKDAIGISSKVASILSGADFDGDTVVVIPNNSGEIRRKKPLEQLKGFEPKEEYAYRDGMRVMKSGQQTQMEMGTITNLITDMHIGMASDDEIARAVKHSMVVIDAAKHKLDFERSYDEQGIESLKSKYQTGGASTLISRAKSPVYVDERSDRYGIDKTTGQKIYFETGKTVTKTTKTGKVKTTKKKTESSKMAETTDARTLSSGSLMEEIYATHANKLKALANQARKETLIIKNTPYSPSARETYRDEVETLKAKLNEVMSQKPLERRARTITEATVKSIVLANPDLKSDKKAYKKIQAQALAAARARVGKKSLDFEITDKEWEAMQSGAVTAHMLSEILQYGNQDRIKELATPRTTNSLTPSKEAKIRSMAAAGYTQAEIASMTGLSVSTIVKVL